jgi:hypothetical protein
MYLPSFTNILKQGQLPEGYKPSEIDILCGRGGVCLEHAGNITFSDVVRANLQKYIEAPKRIDKGIVVNSVVDSLKESGVRFIKQDKHSKLYCELSHDQAHEKTGHAIRDLLKNDTRPPRSRKMTKKTLPGDTESSRMRRSKAFGTISRDFISKSVSQDELSCSQAEIMPNKIRAAVFEIPDAICSFDDDDDFTPHPLTFENVDNFELWDSNLLKNEQEQQGGYVISSSFLAPLPLSSETRIERADIRRLFEILFEDYPGP